MGAYSRLLDYLNRLIRAKPYHNPLGAMRAFADELYKVVPGLTFGATYEPDPIFFPGVYQPAIGTVGEKDGELYVSNDLNPANVWIWQGGAWNGLAGGAGSTPQALAYYHKFPDDSDDISGYREITGGAFPSNITWWTSPAKTAKTAEWIISRNAQQLPITVVYRFYAANLLVRTYTDTITYSGVTETSRTRSYV